eukprot:4604767-Prymnesium_polylepis.1
MFGEAHKAMFSGPRPPRRRWPCTTPDTCSTSARHMFDKRASATARAHAADGRADVRRAAACEHTRQRRPRGYLDGRRRRGDGGGRIDRRAEGFSRRAAHGARRAATPAADSRDVRGRTERPHRRAEQARQWHRRALVSA